ncbi:MAG: hypothetical protein HOJ23_07060, partial [Gammaproteobacteria bacterium]|nr:hypothetical protein [Gammaproteobacteria bacterium]
MKKGGVNVTEALPSQILEDDGSVTYHGQGTKYIQIDSDDLMDGTYTLEFVGDYQAWDVGINVGQVVANRSAWATRFGDQMVGLENGQNNFNGQAGDDYIIGGNLRDELEGGQGNDIIDGGGNPAVDPDRPWETWDKYDVVRYDANLVEFDLQRLTDDDGTITGTAGLTYYRVEHLIPGELGGLGTDILYNVERLQFSGSSDSGSDVQLEARIEQLDYYSVDGEQINSQRYIGTIFGDTITGTAENEEFEGGKGGDTIDMGGGNDNGNLGLGDDTVDGGAGWDQVYYTDSINRFDITVHDSTSGTQIGSFVLGSLNGGLASNTFVFTDGSSTAYEASSMVLKINDTLSDQYGGLGVDTLSNVEMVAFEGGALFLGSDTLENIMDGKELPTGWDGNYTVQIGNYAQKPTEFDAGAGNGTTEDDTLIWDDVDWNGNEQMLQGWGGDDTLIGSDGDSDVIDLYYDHNRPWQNGQEYKASFDLTVDDATLTYHLVDSDTNDDNWGADYYEYYQGGELQTGDLSFDLDANTVTLNGTTLQMAISDNSWWTGIYQPGQEGTVVDGIDPSNMDVWRSADLGDDTLNGGLGNDVLVGGADGTTSGSRDNYWDAGDVAMYHGAVIERLNIEKIEGGSYTYNDGSSDITYNGDYYIVTDIASLIDKTGTLDFSSANVDTSIGYGQDALIGIERIQFGETELQLSPISSTYEWTSWWYGADESGDWDSHEYLVTRTYTTGTLFDDLLIGAPHDPDADTPVYGHGDEIDGQAGDDIINGGDERADLNGNAWDLQDVVRYNGSRERYEVSGVLVEVANNGTSRSDYTIVAADGTFGDGFSYTDAEASDNAVFSIMITDILPDSAGGTGTDLLVNVERVEFNGSQLSIEPQIDEWIDWEGNIQVNARGTDFDDTLKGKEGHDWLYGEAGDDTLIGGAGGDELEGGAGNDLLRGGTNGETDEWGWSRTDTARYNADLDRFTVSSVMVNSRYEVGSGEGYDTLAYQVADILPSDDASSLGTDVLVGIENISFNDRWVELAVHYSSWTDWEGNTNANAEGTVFDDTISEQGEGDRDYMRGEEGNDILLGGSNGDNLTGGAGNDVLDGGANGNSGQSWQDQDVAEFSGDQDRYQWNTITVDSDAGTVTVSGTTSTVAEGVLTLDSTLSTAAQSALQRAFDSGNLMGQTSGYLVEDTLDGDFGGDGTDVVFNVERFRFRDGEVELGIRADVWDWSGGGEYGWEPDGNPDSANIMGTASVDTVTLDDIVALTKPEAEDEAAWKAKLEAIRMDIDLREGDDSYIGGSGGESIRTGSGNDYVDAAGNEGTDQWGGTMRDEIRFEGKFERFVLADVTLTKGDDDNWSVTSGRDETLSITTTGDTVDTVASTKEDSDGSVIIDSLDSEGIKQALQSLITNAAVDATTVSGWVVADKLPGDFGGSGVDAIVGAEAFAFNDFWMPLTMDIWYNRAWGDEYEGTPWEDRPIVSANVQGTTGADIIKGNATYDFSGDDWLNGNDGDDTILAGAGGDWIEGGAGDDTIDGGTNGVTDRWGYTPTDTVRYEGEYERYVITTGTDSNGRSYVEVRDTDGEDGDGTDTLYNIESLSFDDNWIRLGMETWTWTDWQTNEIAGVAMNGSFLNDTIDGSLDEYVGVMHHIRGEDGDDILIGGSGPDEFWGGTGNDLIMGGDNGVDMFGNPGSDVAHYDAMSSRYTVTTLSSYTDANDVTYTTETHGNIVQVTDSMSDEDGGDGVDILMGIEAISFWDQWQTLEVTKNFTDFDGDGKADEAFLRGTESADTLEGGKISDVIEGGAGDDTISGGAGGDMITGGAGNDTIDGGAEGTDPWGNPLIDLAIYTGNYADYTVSSATVDNVTTVTVVDNETTNSSDEGTDILTGIEAIQFDDNFINLETSRWESDFDYDGVIDEIVLRGTDLLGDTLAATDDITTTDVDESIINHFLEGMGGADTLTGGSGDDFFEGGSGNDTIVGGDGTDKVRFFGNLSEYTVNSPSSEGAQFTVIKTSDNETDSLTSIEELIFDDQIVKVIVSGQGAEVSSKSVDTDGDKAADQVLWTGTEDTATDTDTDTTADDDNTSDGSNVIVDGFGDLGNDTITGTADMNNVIDGGSGHDTLTGSNLSDIFKPGSGIDTIDGGTNTDLDADGDQLPDIVQYEGNKSAYTIKNIQSSTITLSGTVEAGDSYTVVVGSTSVSYTATAGDATGGLATLATNLASAISTTATTGAVTVNGAVASAATTITVDDSSSVQAGITELLVSDGSSGTTRIQVSSISGNVLTLASGVNAAIADDATVSFTDIAATTSAGVITLTGTGAIFAVSTSVTNGTQAATATDGSAVTAVAVNGANQSGTSLTIDGDDAGDIAAGDYIAYSVWTDSDGDTVVDDGETTAYGPYEVSAGGATLTLASTMGASPADDATL